MRATVIGGGIFGVTASLALRSRGIAVTLVDPGLPHPLAESTDISKAVRIDYGADAAIRTSAIRRYAAIRTSAIRRYGRYEPRQSGWTGSIQGGRYEPRQSGWTGSIQGSFRF